LPLPAPAPVAAGAALYGNGDGARGDPWRSGASSGFDPAEHPVALQLGGSDPEELARAAGSRQSYGYDEINLNVGCPSDRVQSGCFGAVLMERPGLVADCVAAMIDASPVEVTVKCRIGVDEQIPERSCRISSKRSRPPVSGAWRSMRARPGCRG
jgi:tRNA-dihydrouridine synthase